jgi:hypothetical protein
MDTAGSAFGRYRIRPQKSALVCDIWGTVNRNVPQSHRGETTQTPAKSFSGRTKKSNKFDCVLIATNRGKTVGKLILHSRATVAAAKLTHGD